MSKSISKLKDKFQVFAKGASLNDVYRVLYYISLLKYSTTEHLKACHNTAKKVATGPKLQKMSEEGFINAKYNIYTANQNTLDILNMVSLKNLNFKIPLLPNPPVGYGGINELNNTDVFVEAINLDNYYCLLYPNFTYLRPDALLVLKKENKYKLVFVEVEAEKSSWDEWLNRKRYGYLKLAKDMAVFDYWHNMAPILKLSAPDLADFCFSVVIVGNVRKKWGEGFEFCSSLRELY